MIEADDVEQLQVQARALGDPTRHRIFRHLATSDGPVPIAELTAAAGVHHNAVRQHLDHLVAAGMIRQTTARPSGRGRPRLEYSVDTVALGRWGGPGPYEDLSVLLAELVRTGDAAEEVGHRSARRRVRGVGAPRPTAPGSDAARDAVEALLADLTRRGFDPDYVDGARPGHDSGGSDGGVAGGFDAVASGAGIGAIVLRRCPFASAALVDPDTVCELHLGLARGVVAGTGVDVTALLPRDPRRAGCRLELGASPSP